jgi:universal stress protein E
VLQNEYDLVVAGTRHQGALQGLLMGSTGIKLLWKCPCLVWITQPQPKRVITSILAVHDMRPVGDIAMELGCSMAELHGAQLHVLHSLEFPELEYALPARISAEKAAELRAKAEQHINAQLANHEFAKPPQVHIITETPVSAILKHVEKDAVELVVMGTIARTGIAGFVVGNTAERLLPQIPCSILAVKPEASYRL